MLSQILPTFQVEVIPSAALSRAMLDVVDEFREKRTADFMEMAAKAGRNAARTAKAEQSLKDWKAYAHQLENVCMEAGLPMPPAPDEIVIETDDATSEPG
ncbi:hypothetical protein [Methylorubrum populi]|nr:hypothetical protein [Methylorubrum populi]